ncbi:DEAD/DEAH box helicase [Fulvivirga ulvae]|uniref:DEAD/DEAH box helicase n=1 Tax=Fulvivirga ulvae TaxID=2904245 RepID=UPI001F32AF9B|nr:DEAD/DEAH box helicase [Fulvivirga ulvae]UII31286.1 DEAD/DEAH box helicase [Fulvivirga ulvae]
MATFKSLGVSEEFLKALKEVNIVQPTEIQERAIPFLLSKGSDFIGQAQTGTGKTAAFGLPLLHRVDPKNKNVQALILSPTRELGQQIAKQLFKFTKYSEKIYTEAVYGGARIENQIAALRRPTQIVVATPGRLVDLLDRKAIDLSHISTIVLDEADEMLSMGFKKELDNILKRTSGTRNTWLFSATMPGEIKQIIKTYMAPDAYKVEVDKDEIVNASIEHQYMICDASQKLDALIHFVKVQGEKRGIIFCKTKAAAKLLAQQLISKNLDVDAIHGDLMQKERDKVMRAFHKHKVRVLIATDISARGIDVANLAYVAHYQLPDQLEYYTHRSGRTARAGKKGLSICFVEPQEVKRIRQIEKELSISFNQAG